MNGQPPFWTDYMQTRNAESLAPTSVHIRDTALYQFYQRHLLHKASSVFRWEGVPEHWRMELLLYPLYAQGCVAIIDTERYGTLPQPCGLGGRGVQYQPLYALVANPLLPEIKGQPLTIGEDCALIHMMPDYGGIMDVIRKFAAEMTLAETTLQSTQLNSRLAYVFGIAGRKPGAESRNKAGGGKRAAETLKRMVDQIMAGDPAVYVDQELVTQDGKPTWSLFNTEIGRNYIAPTVLDVIRKLEAQFCAAVGIPADRAQSMKERVVVGEVEANAVETATGPSLWLETIRKGVDDANRLFNLNIRVDWRYMPDVPDNHTDRAAELADRKSTNNMA